MDFFLVHFLHSTKPPTLSSNSIYYYTTQRNMSLGTSLPAPLTRARHNYTKNANRSFLSFFLSFFSLLSKQIELPLISSGSRRVTQKVKRKESSSTIHFQKEKEKEKKTLLNLLSRT
jgi:hypothetical protein